MIRWSWSAQRCSSASKPCSTRTTPGERHRTHCWPPPNSRTPASKGNSGKIGPHTFRSPKEIVWLSEVYSNSGALKESCYIQWTLYKNGAPIYKLSTDCSASIPSVWPPRLDAGSYRLVGDVTTDWGVTDKGQVDFQVVSS